MPRALTVSYRPAPHPLLQSAQEVHWGRHGAPYIRWESRNKAYGNSKVETRLARNVELIAILATKRFVQMNSAYCNDLYQVIVWYVILCSITKSINYY